MKRAFDGSSGDWTWPRKEAALKDMSMEISKTKMQREREREKNKKMKQNVPGGR